MAYVYFLITASITGFAIYQNLPALACRLSRRLSTCILSNPANAAAAGLRWKINLRPQGRWLKKLHIRLQKAGFFSDRLFAIYLILLFAPLPVLSLLGWLAGFEGSLPALAGIMLTSLVNTHISLRIKKRQKAYAFALYKIYRFLDMQSAAGIKITDSLRGLPEAAQDPVVRPVLIRFAALYELTLNLELALAEIRQAFPGTDSELLATHLRQCLQTGEAGRSILRMEDLLFSRCFSLMQSETRQVRTQLLLAAVLGMIPGLALFLYPLFYQAVLAMRSVFG